MYTKMSVVLAGLLMVAAACNSKKETSGNEDGSGAYETAEPTAASPDDIIAQGKDLIENSDCRTCHHIKNKILGPSQTEIATKYDFTQATVTMLAERVIKGSSGVWGTAPMAAHATLSQAEAEKMVRYILSLDGEKEH